MSTKTEERDGMLVTLLKLLGSQSIAEFKAYMKGEAKRNEYGAVCYTETREGYTLNYSDNCRHKFGIAANVSGIYSEIRF